MKFFGAYWRIFAVVCVASISVFLFIKRAAVSEAAGDTTVNMTFQEMHICADNDAGGIDNTCEPIGGGDYADNFGVGRVGARNVVNTTAGGNQTWNFPDETRTYNNNHNAGGSAREEDCGVWICNTDSDEIPVNPVFPNYSRMYNQGTLGYVNQTAADTGGLIQNLDYYLRPAGTVGVLVTSSQNGTPVDWRFNWTWPAPTAAVTYWYSLNTANGGNNYNARACGADYVCTNGGSSSVCDGGDTCTSAPYRRY